MANDKAISEPVCLADRRSKSASRSADKALAEGDWVYGPLRITVTEKFLT